MTGNGVHCNISNNVPWLMQVHLSSTIGEAGCRYGSPQRHGLRDAASHLTAHFLHLTFQFSGLSWGFELLDIR